MRRSDRMRSARAHIRPAAEARRARALPGRAPSASGTDLCGRRPRNNSNSGICFTVYTLFQKFRCNITQSVNHLRDHYVGMRKFIAVCVGSGGRRSDSKRSIFASLAVGATCARVPRAPQRAPAPRGRSAPSSLAPAGGCWLRCVAARRAFGAWFEAGASPPASPTPPTPAHTPVHAPHADGPPSLPALCVGPRRARVPRAADALCAPCRSSATRCGRGRGWVAGRAEGAGASMVGGGWRA